MITKSNNKIVLTDFENFDAKSILECGQTFRYKPYLGGYEVFSLDKYAQISQNNGEIVITTDDVEYFYDFFDLDTDYGAICRQVAAFGGVVAEAVEYGKGIRILNQDLTEMIFSFIISANNNIKRIQGIIERLCTALGEKTPYGYAFPTVEAMASADEQLFNVIGCGYRARYLSQTAKTLNNGYDFDFLRRSDTKTARKKLLNLMGIGNKVADCILLFGLRRADVFPVDVWIEKIYHLYFEQGHKKEQIADYLVSLFGANSGYAQQYLYYFQRESIAKESKMR